MIKKGQSHKFTQGSLRRAVTLSTAKYGIGGLLKKTAQPKPVTLARIEFEKALAEDKG